LQRLQTVNRAAFRRCEKARKARNAAIRQAAGGRVPHVDIAAATGVSRSRADKIAGRL
jgi:hypothetical protein